MIFPEITFKIIETKDCPLYDFGDSFGLSGIAVSMDNKEENSFVITTVVRVPPKKKNCKILCGDLSKMVIKYEKTVKIPACLISCSGCSGSIRLEYNNEIQLNEDEYKESNSELMSIMHMLSNFSFFKNIDRNDLKTVLRFFKARNLKKDSIIIRKGEPGYNFYIIISGKVDIINDAGIVISSLGRGEVFGEMSLICEENVGATVKASEDTRILSIDQKHFLRILRKYPTLQLFFTRLMARRLTDSNRNRADDYASGMIGKLTEIPPEALFQTLHANKKTGILTITQLTSGTARFSFRDGALIKAKYKTKNGEDAFYEVLKEKEGRFKFTPGIPPEDIEIPEIGYFMKLLIEGQQRIDEQEPII